MDKETFAFGSFRLIPAQRVLLEDGRPLRLGSRAWAFLVTLVESPGETIRKDQLIARTWPDTVVDEGALRVYVAALRKALGDGQAGRRYIANIPGQGYSCVAPVTREQQQPATAPPDRAVLGGNLPAPLTRIVGRDDIIAALRTQLVRRRFLTIVGPGGIGKTTVAVAIAESVSASYEDGVWFVGLASLPDPDLVASALGTVLGISLPGANAISGLAGWLRDKHALIVLDSCEHVIGAAAAIAEAILKAAARVSVLATSREPLRAEGEWLHRLSSLELPPRSDNLTPEGALQYSAVQLFNERAIATMDEFALRDDDVAPVLEICRRLDGVPLALELAAARVDVFGVKGLAAQLDDRFTVLTSGRRTALPRHQTLRGHGLELRAAAGNRAAHFASRCRVPGRFHHRCSGGCRHRRPHQCRRYFRSDRQPRREISDLDRHQQRSHLSPPARHYACLRSGKAERERRERTPGAPAS